MKPKFDQDTTERTEMTTPEAETVCAAMAMELLGQIGWNTWFLSWGGSKRCFWGKNKNDFALAHQRSNIFYQSHLAETLKLKVLSFNI